MDNRKVGVICSMSFNEMRLTVGCLTKILLDNEVKGINTKKRITNLIEKLNGMLIKQGFKNDWINIWNRLLGFLFKCNFNINNTGSYKMNKDEIGFLLVLILGSSSIILLNWIIN